MRRSKITLSLILQITKSTMKEEPRIKGRGRPRIYPDHLIISLMLYQTLFGLSMREVLEEAERVPPKVPSLSDFHYRAKIQSEKDCQRSVLKAHRHLGQKASAL